MKTVLSRSGDSPQVANKNQEDRGSSCGITQKKDACPAKQKKCRKYGKLSHFARVCRSKAQKVPEINADTTQNSHSLLGLGMPMINYCGGWILMSAAGRSTLRLILGLTLMLSARAPGTSTWPALCSASAVKFPRPAGKMDSQGQFETKLNNIPSTIYIVDNDNSHNLPSRTTASKMDLVKHVNKVTFGTSECQASQDQAQKAQPVQIPLLEKVHKENKEGRSDQGDN